MKLPHASLLLALLLSPLAPLLHADPLLFPQYGFQIDPLDAPPGATNTQAVILFLPAMDGFSPNVNVQIQTYPGDIKAYAALSKKQFDPMGWKVITEANPTAQEWTVEYTGTMQNASLHWYARAISSNGKVYLVTATANAAAWPAASTPLKACVNSFKIK